MAKIGAHVSSAAPLVECVDRACAIGAETLQVFASGPQSWRPLSHSEEAQAALLAHARACGVAPLFLHGIYLINLASQEEVHRNRSVGSLKQYLRFAELTGAAGVIFHTGSHKGAGFEAVLPEIARSIERVLADVPGETRLYLENSAGQGGTVGARFEELGAIIRAVGSPRVEVCLDTCHAFAAGYDLRTAAGCATMLEDFATHVGLERLAVVHANDSKGALGCALDRHENIGEGQIGLEGFRALFAQTADRDLPFILEVPGFDGKGPDQRNIDTLRRLAAEAG